MAQNVDHIHRGKTMKETHVHCTVGGTSTTYSNSIIKIK